MSGWVRVRSIENLARTILDPTLPLYEKTSLIITTNLSFSEWVTVFGDATMTMIDGILHH